MRGLRAHLGGLGTQFQGVTARVGSFGKSLLGLGPAFLGAAGPAAFLTSVIAGIKKTMELSKTQEMAERKLQAVLKATGGAAGRSLSELKEFASGLQQATNYGDDAILEFMAKLGTFKNVASDTFERATAVALDMSAVMEQDLKASAVQLGKALNDPIRGISALSRVGVTFSQDQKDLIATLQETGDLAGAQAVMLKELENEFGGAAKAMADPVDQLHNDVGDLGELIGAEFLPVVRLAASELKTWLTGTGDDALNAADKISRIGEVINVVVATADVLNREWAKMDYRSAQIASNVVGMLSGLARAAKVMGDAFPWAGERSALDQLDDYLRGLDSLIGAQKEAAKARWMEAQDATPWVERLEEFRKALADLPSPLAMITDGMDDIDDSLVKATESAEDLLEKLRLDVEHFGEPTVIRQLRELLGAGADTSTIEEAQRLFYQLEDMKLGQRLTEGLQAPMEKFRSEMGDLERLLEAGAITPDIGIRAIEAAQNRLAGAQARPETPLFAPAMEEGSLAAYRTIIEARADMEQDPMRDLLDEAREQTDHLANVARLMEVLAEGGEGLPAGELLPTERAAQEAAQESADFRDRVHQWLEDFHVQQREERFGNVPNAEGEYPLFIEGPQGRDETQEFIGQQVGLMQEHLAAIRAQNNDQPTARTIPR